VTENCALAVAKLGFLDPCVKFTDWPCCTHELHGHIL
jgi:hypothetical protein